MRVRIIFGLFALALFLAVGQANFVVADQAQAKSQADTAFTETLRVMGKGVDHIFVGEEPLYVVPEITKITNRSGATIDLAKLRTPCLAEVTYARWMRGVDKLPVVIHLRVKRVYRGSTAAYSLE